MNDAFKINLKRIGIYMLIFLILNIIFNFLLTKEVTSTVIKLNILQGKDTELQVFYDSNNGAPLFREENSIKKQTISGKSKSAVEFEIPYKRVGSFRLDFGDQVGNTISLNKIIVLTHEGEYIIDREEFDYLYSNGNIEFNQIEISSKENMLFITTGNDPYIVIKNLEAEKFKEIFNKNIFIVSIIVSLVLTIILYRYVYLKDIFRLAKDIYIYRRLLIKLAINDFKAKFVGSYFGIIWAFIQPICTILLFWFVFEVGLKSMPIANIPYVLWLSTGLIPWFFFSDAWNSGTGVFLEYSYLVKKVVFKADILPLVKIVSALFIHIFFMVFLLVIFLLYNLVPQVSALVVIYYMFCMLVLVCALTFITSSLIVFIRDLSPFMSIVLQFGMWLTPIMWTTDILPHKVVEILKINPMYYIIQGYRWCIVGSPMIQPTIKEGVYFWFITTLLFFVGISLYRRLKVHFADVL